MSGRPGSNLGDLVETIRFIASAAAPVQTSLRGSTVVVDGVGLYHVVLAPDAQVAPGSRTVQVAGAVIDGNAFSFASEIVAATTAVDRVNVGALDTLFAFAHTDNPITVNVYRSGV